MPKTHCLLYGARLVFDELSVMKFSVENLLNIALERATISVGNMFANQCSFDDFSKSLCCRTFIALIEC